MQKLFWGKKKCPFSMYVEEPKQNKKNDLKTMLEP